MFIRMSIIIAKNRLKYETWGKDAEKSVELDIPEDVSATTFVPIMQSVLFDVVKKMEYKAKTGIEEQDTEEVEDIPA